MTWEGPTAKREGLLPPPLLRFPRRTDRMCRCD